MLKAMQNRGQEGAGITSTDGKQLFELKNFGLVDEVFRTTDFGTHLPGTSAIGHIRYSTAGDPGSYANLQPLVASHGAFTPFAVAHNGNLTNHELLRTVATDVGYRSRTTSDTEMFLFLIARAAHPDITDAIADACMTVEGAFALLILTPDTLCAVTDPFGFRPLSVAQYGDGFVFASETRAFDMLAAQDSTAIKPGTIFRADRVNATKYARSAFGRRCSFEHVYFSMPDSMPFGVSSNKVREKLGRLLAQKNTVRTDIVTPVPDSSNAMAVAYAEESGLPFRLALIRNHYTGRTFITPKQPARELGVRMKLNVVRDLVNGKTVTVVDDSLVRGTTISKVVALLRNAGATEVHVRIPSPPVIHPCWWGIDTPSFEELSAAHATPAELEKKLGLDSLLYLSLEELREALGDSEGVRYCTTCFTGVQPTIGADLVRLPTTRKTA
jgi:amidophosphoribosyltransferase